MEFYLHQLFNIYIDLYEIMKIMDILKRSRDCLLYTKKETNRGLFTIKP